VSRGAPRSENPDLGHPFISGLPRIQTTRPVHHSFVVMSERVDPQLDNMLHETGATGPKDSSCVEVKWDEMMIDFGDAVESGLSLHEINAGIPRRVRPSDGTRKSLWLLFFVLGVLALLAWWYVHFKIQETRHRETLSSEGRETPARITKVNHGRHSNHVYYTFRFNGAAYQGNAESDESVWDAHVGEYIPIQFLPSDPSVNHPTPWVLWDLPDFIYIAVLLLSFGAMAKAAFWVYGERRLARIGWVTEGKGHRLCAEREPFSSRL
jgi:cytochrome c-type biogenesis protein CcmH/NrfF